MRIALACCVLLTAVAAGCDNRIDAAPRIFQIRDTETSADLSVAIAVHQQQVVPGEQLHVEVTARNLTKKPITINARSGAPVYVRIWQDAGRDEVERYPRTEMMVARPWTLAPRAERSFVLSIPVEPNWPTGEILRVTAELNGRGDLTPSVHIEVLSVARSRQEMSPE